MAVADDGDEPDHNVPVRGWTWSAEDSELHINILELLAVQVALTWLPKFDKLTLVRIATDSQVVYYCLRALYTRSSALHTVLIRILSLIVKHNIQLDVMWVSTHDNPADMPSRLGLDFISHPALPEWDLS